MPVAVANGTRFTVLLVETGCVARAWMGRAQYGSRTGPGYRLLACQAGNGLVQVTTTGAGEVRSVRIDPQVVDPDDVETLQDLVVGALQDAARAAQELQAEKMGPLAGGLGGAAGGLGLPGLDA